MNAKNELLDCLGGQTSDVVCAYIEYYDKKYVLRKGWTPYDFDRFIQSLDFEYDSGYGCQELFGNVWFNDGTWLDRDEYDGSEWWVCRRLPDIPRECV